MARVIACVVSLLVSFVAHTCAANRDAVKDDIPDEDKWSVTKTAYFDISVDMDEPRRVTIALFGEAAPNTVNNFAALAKGNYRGDVRELNFLIELKLNRTFFSLSWFFLLVL